jgi:hypothetical protein
MCSHFQLSDDDLPQPPARRREAAGVAQPETGDSK